MIVWSVLWQLSFSVLVGLHTLSLVTLRTSVRTSMPFFLMIVSCWMFVFLILLLLLVSILRLVMLFVIVRMPRLRLIALSLRIRVVVVPFAFESFGSLGPAGVAFLPFDYKSSFSSLAVLLQKGNADACAGCCYGKQIRYS